MNPVLTNAGRAYIANRDANDLPVVLDEFRLGNPNVGGSAPSDPDPAMTAQTSVVWSGPPTAEGLLAADSVVYSLLIGTNVGDFEITQVGLWSDTGVLVYVANIPIYHKRASGPSQLGNNFIFNANILYAGIAALAEMQAAAETWQQDFTALLALKENKADKGAANGYPSLNAAQKVVQEPASKGLAGGIASLDAVARLTAAQVPRGIRLATVVIGSAAQVAAGAATHTINDLADGICPAGTLVVALKGTHSLSGNRSLSSADVEIAGESSEAILDFNGFTFTLSGARAKLRLKFATPANNSLVLSGVGTLADCLGLDMDHVAASGGARVIVDGAQIKTLADADQTLPAWVPSLLAINPSVQRTLTVPGTGYLGPGFTLWNKSAAVDVVLRPEDTLTAYTLKAGHGIALKALKKNPTTGSDWEKAGGTGRRTVYASSGTFTIPAFVRRLKAIVTAGGGGGEAGNGATSGTARGGGAGAAGGTAIGELDVQPGTVETVTVGPGGAGGTGVGGNGGTGSNSSFKGLQATGGEGGGIQLIASGGRGGTASGGDLNLIGGDGTFADAWTVAIGIASQKGGKGGDSYWGGGGRGSDSEQDRAEPGKAPGSGGGGGGGSTSGSSGLGKAGANGVVVIEY